MKYILYSVSLFATLLFFTSNAQAQTRTISGVVKNADTGKALPGVNILVEGAQNGTVTNVEGKFKITVSRSDTLRFTAIGFKTREIDIQDQQKLTVLMHRKTTKLSEMVVIGFGKQSKATLTTSISKVDASVFNNVPFASAADALQGTVPGLRVQRSGQPGSTPTIVLRGGTSISDPNSSNPLYVIDGIRRDNMNGINPSDIKSIQVLKDAASTAIYGARASNGVIIIKTKTGQSGEFRINVNSSVTLSKEARLWKLANARQYIYYNRLGVAATAEKHPQYLSQLDLPKGFGTGNDLTKETQYTTMYLTPENKFLLSQGWSSMPDPLDSSKTIIFKGVNWQKKLFRRTFSENNYISASGGSNKATFRIGAGYLHNNGVAISSGYKRLTFNAKGSVQVLDNLQVRGIVNYTNSSNRNGFSSFDVFSLYAGLAPTMKFRFLDGTLGGGTANPVYKLRRTQVKNNLSHLSLTLQGTWDILPHLIFKPTISLYNVNGIKNKFMKSHFGYLTHTINDARDATASHRLFWKKEADGILKYENAFFNNNNVSAEIGFSYNDRKIYNLGAHGRGAATDEIPTLNASPLPVSVSSGITIK